MEAWMESFSNLNTKQIEQNAESSPILAIVVPCYNEEAVITHTHNALQNKLKNLIESRIINPQSFLCYVDDGSKDKTWTIISQFALESNAKIATTTALQNITNTAADTFIPPPPLESHNQINNVTSACSTQSAIITTRAIRLSKNVGHQNALLAGLQFVMDKCACVISIDADLQDDIAVFDEFIKEFKQGKEVVYGVRKCRDTDTAFKRSSALAFYNIMAFLGVRIVHNHADYRLLSARALRALFEFKEVNLFLRGIVPLLGFQSSIVEYDRLARYAGESKYPLRKMLSFAWNGITSFSIMPLRVVSVIGFVFFFLSLVLGGWVLCVRLFTDEAIYGWASTIIPLSFFSGVQLLSLGVIGEYIGKIYQESKARPRYFIERVV